MSTAATTETTPKKKTNPLKIAERNLAKAIKLVAEGQGTDEQKALFTRGLKGMERLFQTIEQIADPANPPAPESAWGKVIALVENETKAQQAVANLMSLGPQDVF